MGDATDILRGKAGGKRTATEVHLGIGTGVAVQPKTGSQWLREGMKTPPVTEAEKRKAQPVATGVLGYFPDALLAVAEVSRIGNEQHNPGEPLHWARSKSTDQLDAAVRHIIDKLKGEPQDSDGGRHLAKAAWRILAELQLEIEKELAEDYPDPMDYPHYGA